MSSDRWTPKGKPKDGYYYDGECPRCGKVQVAYLRGLQGAVCSNCNRDQGVTITEKSDKKNKTRRREI